jgi:hypothetical protein
MLKSFNLACKPQISNFFDTISTVRSHFFYNLGIFQKLLLFKNYVGKKSFASFKLLSSNSGGKGGGLNRASFGRDFSHLDISKLLNKNLYDVSYTYWTFILFHSHHQPFQMTVQPEEHWVSHQCHGNAYCVT